MVDLNEANKSLSSKSRLLTSEREKNDAHKYISNDKTIMENGAKPLFYSKNVRMHFSFSIYLSCCLVSVLFFSMPFAFRFSSGH